MSSISVTMRGVIADSTPIEHTKYGSRMKLTILVGYGEERENYYQIEVKKDAIVALITTLPIGAEVIANCSLRGIKYQKKSDGNTAYFTTLECWKLEPVNNAATQSAPAAALFDGPTSENPFPRPQGTNEDISF